MKRLILKLPLFSEATLLEIQISRTKVCCFTESVL